MSWLSKLSGSDAKKRNTRKLQDALIGGQQNAAAGMDPTAAFAGTGDAINDWSRTNNRVNMQTGLKGAAAVAGGALLGGGGAGLRPLSAGAPGGAGGATGVAQSAAGGGGLMGGLRTLGGSALDNMDLILSGAGMIQGAAQQGKADKYNQQALELAKQPWNETAGLRSMSLQRLMNPQKVDLSHLYANSSNPFSR